MEKFKKVGVLGGMGPLATVVFYNKVIALTEATCDQDHIDMVIYNDASIPDRTAYILDNTKENPLPYLQKDIKDLESIGCDILALPCNTAHYFYEKLNHQVPLLNMVDLVLKKCSYYGYKKVMLLATRGTISSGVYEKFNSYGIELVHPNEEMQAKMDDFIFNYVKQNKVVSKEMFYPVLDEILNTCDGVILGCTELSVIYENLSITDKKVVDSTTVLAQEVVSLCDKKII